MTSVILPVLKVSDLILTRHLRPLLFFSKYMTYFVLSLVLSLLNFMYSFNCIGVSVV